jgi:uncharacterized repeat protein (TIGR03843 family)
MADPVRDANHREALELEQVLALLREGKLELYGQFLWGSNYTFLAEVSEGDLSVTAVYKPCAGERPLWDFDHETLCQREVAAYLVSMQLGWPNIPPTALGKGPHGPGSIQLYIDGDHEEHFFSLRETGHFDEAFRRIALFDVLVNNADRKGGHCLLGNDGRIWSIDHGLTFHAEYKLRTVIWDYAGEAIPPEWLDDLRGLDEALAPGRPLRAALAELITGAEIEALIRRLRRLVRRGELPRPGPGRNVPYPLI